jgi:hypothetical protein
MMQDKSPTSAIDRVTYRYQRPAPSSAGLCVLNGNSTLGLYLAGAEFLATAWRGQVVDTVTTTSRLSHACFCPRANFTGAITAR